MNHLTKWLAAATFFVVTSAPIANSVSATPLNKPVVASCQADGATVEVAIEAFKAVTGKSPMNEQALTAKGAYLLRWPKNSPFYSFSLEKNGALRVEVPAGSEPKPFTKAACLAAGEVHSATDWGKRSAQISACKSDASVVQTAIQAFIAVNNAPPSSQAQLTSANFGGPYLTNWPSHQSHYSFSLTSRGILMITAPSTSKARKYHDGLCNFAG